MLSRSYASVEPFDRAVEPIARALPFTALGIIATCVFANWPSGSAPLLKATAKWNSPAARRSNPPGLPRSPSSARAKPPRRPKSPPPAASIVPLEWPSPSPRTVIRAPEPRTAFARALNRFYPTAELKPGIHPTAVVGKDVEMGALVYIGPHAVVGDGARIGVATALAPAASSANASRSAKAASCTPTSPSTTTCDIGRGAVLHSGCVIGADGFGYVMEHGRWHKFPQVGRVEIGDFVEIGANSCVDRAALGVTSIGEGTKLDNMVHVGHNCRIGRHVVVAAQTGFSGGVVVEDYAVIGGQVGIGDKARIESRAVLGFGMRRAHVEDRRARRHGLGHARASAQAAPRTTRQPRAPAGNAPRIGGTQAPPRGTGAERLMLVVVGGHSRNIGKTSIAAGLIRALPEFQLDRHQDHAIRPRHLLQSRPGMRLRSRRRASVRIDRRVRTQRHRFRPLPGRRRSPLFLAAHAHRPIERASAPLRETAGAKRKRRSSNRTAFSIWSSPIFTSSRSTSPAPISKTRPPGFSTAPAPSSSRDRAAEASRHMGPAPAIPRPSAPIRIQGTGGFRPRQAAAYSGTRSPA